MTTLPTTRSIAQDLIANRKRSKPGEATAFLEGIAADPPDTDECILWPFALNGSGHAVWRGSSVARWLLGLEPGDPFHALHTCHQPDCVNPRHLIAGTPQENSDMMVRSGRSLKGDQNAAVRREL